MCTISIFNNTLSEVCAMRLKFELFGGEYRHTNYIAELTKLNHGTTAGLGRLHAKNTDEEFAQMSQAMSMVLNSDGSCKQLATYTNIGLPLAERSPKGLDYFIGSNKHNACPLIFIRNKKNQTTTLFMWHLAYADLERKPHQEVQQYLPSYFTIIENDSNYKQFHIKSILSDPASEILVTDSSLIAPGRFNCRANAKMLKLPESLEIVSSGVEGLIRSYSIAYFPKNDLLVLSGDAEGQSYFWVMQDPFSLTNEWTQLQTCNEMIKLVKEDKSNKDVSQLFIDQLELIKANNPDLEESPSFSLS